MKVVAVIFALAVVSGCQGRFLFQDEPKAPWEQAVERFWEYVSDLSDRAESVRKNIQDSEISRELDTLVADSLSELRMYGDDVQTKLGPYTQEASAQLLEDMRLLAAKLQAHAANAKERAGAYGQELAVMLEHNAADINNRGKAYARKLKKRLGKDTEEINKKMVTYLDELQSRAYQNAEMVRERFEPYLNQVRENAEEKLTTLNDLLKSQTEEVRQKLEARAEEVRERLEQQKESLHSTLEEKAEELRAWFQPFVARVQEQLQTAAAAIQV